MASTHSHEQTSGAELASLSEVIRTYVANHGVSVAQIGKAATQLGFMDKLEADLRGALNEGRQIRNWSTYVVDALQYMAANADRPMTSASE